MLNVIQGQFFTHNLDEYLIPESLELIQVIRQSITVLFEPLIIDGVVAPCYAWIETENLRNVYDGLLAGSPSIKALYEPFFITDEAANRITFKAEYLLPGDMEIIINRVKELTDI